MEAHGHVRLDEYNKIRFDAVRQRAIIARENKIFKQWNDRTVLQWKTWRDHVFKRQDPGVQQQIPETFGGYSYFIEEKEYPPLIAKELKPGDEQRYVTYNRMLSRTLSERETVLDIVDDLL